MNDYLSEFYEADKPFLIGGINIFDFQAEGFSTWRAFETAETGAIREACSVIERFKQEPRLLPPSPFERTPLPPFHFLPSGAGRV